MRTLSRASRDGEEVGGLGGPLGAPEANGAFGQVSLGAEKE